MPRSSRPKSRPFSRLSVAQLGGAPRTYRLHGRRPPENAGPLPCQAGPPDEAQHEAPSRRRTPGTPSPPGAQRPSRHAGMVKVTRKRRWEEGGARARFHFLEPPPPPTPPLAAGLSAAPQATFSAPGRGGPKSRPFSRLGVAPPWAHHERAASTATAEKAGPSPSQAGPPDETRHHAPPRHPANRSTAWRSRGRFRVLWLGQTSREPGRGQIVRRVDRVTVSQLLPLHGTVARWRLPSAAHDCARL